MRIKGIQGRLRVLTRKQLYNIHLATLDLLEHTGVKVRYGEALKLLDAAGANVDYKKQIVKIPRHLVREALMKTPSSIILAGRNSRNDLKLEDGKTYFGTLGTAPYVQDLETGKRRPATKKDVEDFARVADALENIHYFHTMANPSDVPLEICDLHRWEATLRNTAKHAMGGAVYKTENMPYLIRMCCAVIGDEEKLRKRPIISIIECPVSPLIYDTRGTHNIIEFSKRGLPIMIYSEPQAGASAPVTLAGTLVIVNAEVLSGITIVQLVNPGTPVIYASVATIMDMKAANIAFGSPETGLLSVATTQLARYYNVPNLCAGGRADSKIPDAQAGYEKARNALISALAGSNLNNMAGALESNLKVSFEQLIIDNEIVGTIKRVIEGIEVTDETLALEVIKKVGPGGLYLAEDHTLKYLKKEHYMPKIDDRRSYGAWEKTGAKNVAEVAKEKAKEILTTYQPEPLSKEIQKELASIIREAEKS